MQVEEKLKVNLENRSYDIIIGSDLIANAGRYLKPVLPMDKVFIVTDKNVAKLYLKILKASLDAEGIRHKEFILEPGEGTKNFDNLISLLNGIFENKPERKSTIIALGGGVMGDLAGFTASILLRGVNFVQIPTTLLAQVDSSVGGKTGINNKFGKNLVGSFYQPSLVLTDISTLKDLPEREYLAGYAEVVKYALLGDREFFYWLVDNIGKIKSRDAKALAYMVKKSCQMKADIVSKDEKEGGLRALLNLGHTFGHALELDMGYDGRLLHGEAVAIGMVLAFELSAKLNLCDQGEVALIKKHLSYTGLPVSMKDIKKNWSPKGLLESMFQDKKVSEGKLVLIVANKIGDAFIKKDVDSADILYTIEKHIK